jgi:hypothetical protein
MKNIFFLVISAAIIMISTTGCKKSSVPTITTSQWSIDGKTYIATSTAIAEVQGYYFLESTVTADTTLNVLGIVFGKLPTGNEKLGVVDASTVPNDKQCIVDIGYDIPSLSTFHVITQSAGTLGDSVLITIVNGKLEASFSGIAMINSQSILSSLSGTLIQQ